MVAAEASIILQQLVKSYREGARLRRVLDGVQASFAAGEAVALLGRSGSGKSTLLNLMAGIDEPDSGQVLIDGNNLTKLSERERTLFRRRHIGFIYQFFNLIATLTVEENVCLPIDLNGGDRAASVATARTLLTEVGLGGRERSFPDQLSGGEQQRVAIARALAHAPSLILADEPTGNLDAETGRHVLGLLTQMVRERRKTLVIVTHSREVAQSTDRILLIEGGALVERTDAVVW